MDSKLNDEVSNLCNKLDEVSIEKLKLFDEIIKSKKSMENQLQMGFLMLSKARYVMGVSAVSRLQIPNEDSIRYRATVHTSISKEIHAGIESRAFHIISATDMADNNYTNLNEKAVYSTEARRRKESEGSMEMLSIKTNSKTPDPMQWFSALPPQSLRQAQKYFQSAVKLSAQIATLQDKLIAIKEYTVQNS